MNSKAFHGKRNNLTLEGGLQTRRSRLKLIAVLLACALATGEAAVILQVFQNNSFAGFASKPPANKLRGSYQKPMEMG